MNLNIPDFAVGFHLAFSFIERIVNFALVIALLIVELICTITRKTIRSLAVCLVSDWIQIVYIRPPPKPPDKITTSILQHLMIKLIVKLFAKPAFFRMIVESEFSLKYQINSKLPSSQAFEMRPTDPSKTTTAIATIAPLVQPKDSATSTMTIEPNVPFVKPTVDPNISSGEEFFEPREYFMPARRILFDNTERERRQSNISSADQFHSSQCRIISNLETSVFRCISNIPSQVCEGESRCQTPGGSRKDRTEELENSISKNRKRDEQIISSALLLNPTQEGSHLNAASATKICQLPREIAKSQETAEVSHSLPRDTQAHSKSYAIEQIN